MYSLQRAYTHTALGEKVWPVPWEYVEKRYFQINQWRRELNASCFTDHLPQPDVCDALVYDISGAEVFPDDWHFWYTKCRFYLSDLKEYFFEVVDPVRSRISETANVTSWWGISIIYANWPVVLLTWSLVTNRMVQKLVSLVTNLIIRYHSDG